jgi:hypothetical protein
VALGSDGEKLGEPEKTYRDKSVCVTGRIKKYRGVLEVVDCGPAEIKFPSGSEK